MLVGIIHTVGSPCRCAESVAEGLASLGHTPVVADSEEIPLRAPELAQACDFIIDHTDTFSGSGLLRSHVRKVLESFGAQIVGADSDACFLADHKIAARSKLASAGIPIPPGIVVTLAPRKIPAWLQPPYIIKTAYEHMSRDLKVARTREEAEETAAALLRTVRQPLLIESYIRGRELAVSVLEAAGGLRVLPPLEWRIGEGETDVLTKSFKLQEVPKNRQDAARADLASSQLEALQAWTVAAFRALGLRDYARFDVKLAPSGMPLYLEANITPSLEPEEAFPLSARWAGIDYPSLVNSLLAAAQRRYGPRHAQGKEQTFSLSTGSVFLSIPEGVHHPPASTVELAIMLDVKPGDRVLELGCGSGLLSIAAAKLGATCVLATDLDAAALDATLVNARRNGVGDRLEVRAGFWYEALTSRDKEPFDVVIATPPQTPGKRPFGPQYGGSDGTTHLLMVVDSAHQYVRKDTGRLWMLVISLANTKTVLKKLEERFTHVSVMKTTDRFFTPEKYEQCDKGLFSYLLALRDKGCSEFEETSKGEYVFHNLFIRAGGPRVL